MGEVVLPGFARVVAEEFLIRFEQLRILFSEIMRVAEEHFQIARQEFAVILEYIRMPDRHRLGRISGMARLVPGQFEALTGEEQLSRARVEYVAVAGT